MTKAIKPPTATSDKKWLPLDILDIATTRAISDNNKYSSHGCILITLVLCSKGRQLNSATIDATCPDGIESPPAPFLYQLVNVPSLKIISTNLVLSIIDFKTKVMANGVYGKLAKDIPLNAGMQLSKLFQ